MPVRALLVGTLLAAALVVDGTSAQASRPSSAGSASAGALLHGSVAATGFRLSVSGPLARSDVAHSWRPGCPVAPWRLRAVTMTYRGFDGRVRTGTLVVRKAAVAVVRTAFRRAFDAGFRIRRMVPVEAYYRGGSVSPARSDVLSMEADNTSAFNCRPKTGRRSFSEHSYGLAVDVNPYENPARAGSRIYPAAAAGRYYRNRAAHLSDPGVLTGRSALTRGFAAAGWGWGGRWSGGRDYQHFSRSGR